MTDRDEEMAREFWLGHHPPQNYPFQSHDPIKCKHCGPPLIALLKKARREGYENAAKTLDAKYLHLRQQIEQIQKQAKREGESAMQKRASHQAKWKGKIGHIKVHSYEAGVVDGRNEASSEIIRLEPETPEVVK